MFTPTVFSRGRTLRTRGRARWARDFSLIYSYVQNIYIYIYIYYPYQYHYCYYHYYHYHYYDCIIVIIIIALGQPLGTKCRCCLPAEGGCLTTRRSRNPFRSPATSIVTNLPHSPGIPYTLEIPHDTKTEQTERCMNGARRMCGEAVRGVSARWLSSACRVHIYIYIYIYIYTYIYIGVSACPGV